MHPGFESDEELCKWLRNNCSGSYRLAGFAADRIEELNKQLQAFKSECESLVEALAVKNGCSDEG